MAWIGCGVRGKMLTRRFMQLPGIRFVAVCDVNVSRLAGGRTLAGGEKEQTIDDPEASALVAKPYRAP